MRLHQLNKASYSEAIERDIGCSITPLDKVLLIEDATIRLLNKSDRLLDHLNQEKTPIYALESDLKAYGITHPPGHIKCISDTEWVALTNECSHHIAW